MNAAAEARKATLQRILSRPGADDPAVIAQKAERAAIVAAREARVAARNEAKLAAEERDAHRNRSARGTRAAGSRREGGAGRRSGRRPGGRTEGSARCPLCRPQGPQIVNNATLIEAASATSPEASPCQTCGACCSFAPDWPRFTHRGRLRSRSHSRPACRRRLVRHAMRSAIAAPPWWERSASRPPARSTTSGPMSAAPAMPGDEACGIARSRFGLAELTL